MRRSAYIIPDWLGLNTEVASEILAPGELVDCDNWEPNQPGKLIRRAGSEALSAQCTQSLRRIAVLRSGSGEPAYVLGLAATGAYAAAATTWPPTSWVVVSGSEAATHTSARDAVYKDNLFFVSACNPYVISDDLKYRTAYLDGPTGAPTVALGAAGNLNGTYYYKWTWRSSRRLGRNVAIIESNPSPQSASIAPVNQKVQLDVMADGGDADASDKRIYRKKSSGLFYYVSSIPQGATSYLDNVADTGLGAAMHDETHNVPYDLLQPLKHIEVHLDRLFCAGDSFRVIYSQPGAPFYWGFTMASGKSANYLDIPAPEEEGMVTGLYSMGEVLVIFTKRAIWHLAGRTRSSFSVYRAKPIGCVAWQSVARSPYGVFFLSERGVELYTGSQVEEVSAPIRQELRALIGDGARGVWFKDRYLLRVSTTRLYAFWPESKRWARYNVPESKWEKDQLLTVQRSEREYLYGISAAEDRKMVELLKEGTTDDEGTAIAPSLTTGHMDLGTPFRNKAVKRVQVDAVAGSTSASTLAIIITPALQGTAVSASWVMTPSTRTYAASLPGGCVGDDFSVAITHLGAGQELQIHRVNLEYAVRESSRR